MNTVYEHFKNKKVLLTGDTGFKGSWLAHLLCYVDAKVYGFTRFERHSKNYFMQFLDNPRNKKVTRSPVDQFFNPIYADAILEINKNAIEKDIHRIFDIGSDENISKYEFNKKIIRRFHFDAQQDEGIKSASFMVSGPHNGTISSRHIQETLEYKISVLNRMIKILFQSICGYQIIG